MSFQKELTRLINCYSQENGSDTPDFILAEYLVQCLTAFNNAINQREKWYGRDNVESHATELKEESVQRADQGGN